MKSLNDKDKRILAMLMENARRSYKEIAEDLKVNLSESSVRKRVNKLKNKGIIEKFTIKLSFVNEDSIIAFLTVIPSNSENITGLLGEMQLIPQCIEVYKLIQNEILVKINVPNVNEMDALIESFQGRSDVKSVERVSVVLRPIKSPSHDEQLLI